MNTLIIASAVLLEVTYFTVEAIPNSYCEYQKPSSCYAPEQLCGPFPSSFGVAPRALSVERPYFPPCTQLPTPCPINPFALTPPPTYQTLRYTPYPSTPYTPTVPPTYQTPSNAPCPPTSAFPYPAVRQPPSYPATSSPLPASCPSDYVPQLSSSPPFYAKSSYNPPSLNALINYNPSLPALPCTQSSPALPCPPSPLALPCPPSSPALPYPPLPPPPPPPPPLALPCPPSSPALPYPPPSPPPPLALPCPPSSPALLYPPPPPPPTSPSQTPCNASPYLTSRNFLFPSQKLIPISANSFTPYYGAQPSATYPTSPNNPPKPASSLYANPSSLISPLSCGGLSPRQYQY